MRCMDTNHHITLHDVHKSFPTAGGVVDILKGAHATIDAGEHVAIVGPSGSGKSTLLGLLAGLDTPSTGTVTVHGRDLATLNEREIAHYRNASIGIIFQSFELITPFTVRENIQAPLDIAKKSDPTRVDTLMQRVGLSHRAHADPRTLSGGEKQRVAIARALVAQPPLILADEPTGSLDTTTGAEVFELLLEEVTREKKTLVMITHDRSLAGRMDRILVLRDGMLYDE